MGKIDRYVSFVKKQVEVQQKLAEKYEDTPFRKAQHLETARSYADLGTFLTEIQKKGTHDISYLNRGDNPLKRMHLTFEDIHDLSEDNLRELNLTEADRQDLVVEHLIAQNGGVYSLDKIMIDLFRQTKEFPKRGALVARLYRMAQKGMIYNVPGKKGVYSTYEMSEQEAKKMFGADMEESAVTAPPTENPASTPSPQEKKGLGASKYLNSAANPERRF
jgi:hypothetical protein